LALLFNQARFLRQLALYGLPLSLVLFLQSPLLAALFRCLLVLMGFSLPRFSNSVCVVKRVLGLFF
jgi:hypothetical protein